jgi:hypothetical protein
MIYHPPKVIDAHNKAGLPSWQPCLSDMLQLSLSYFIASKAASSKAFV